MPADTIPLTLRVPKSVLAKLDAWVEELNARRRRGRAMSRNELIRMTLDWAADERPDVEGVDRPPGGP